VTAAPYRWCTGNFRRLCRYRQSRRPITHLPKTSLDRERPMRAQGQERLRLLNLSPKPAWTEVWHLWKVIIPRRSISGKLLTGQVWRRYDGRRWIYKRFTEYSD
jgi:hypothetical protein